MKLLYLPLLIIMYLIPAVSFADPIDRVAELIQQGNIHELSKLFAPTIDITLQGDENAYSKADAEVALTKFFNQNKPRAVKILHKLNSNAAYNFGVLIVTTDNGTYRIACTLNNAGGNLKLIELRIETEKVK